MAKLPEIVVSDGKKGINRKVCQYFAMGCGGRIVSCEEAGDNIATFGILRGTGEVIKKAKNFWYIDHGYMGRSTPPKSMNGYFRIVHNNFWHDGSGNYPSDRLEEAVPYMFNWRKNGNHIVVVPPSQAMSLYLGLESWLEDTIKEIKKYSDRKIIVTKKSERGIPEKPLKEHLKNAWVLVTDHSNAAMEAMLRGIPSIMTNPQRRLSSIKNIENPPLDRSILNNLAYQQWSLKDMRNGKAWQELKRGNKQ